jgi:hypothetical protein
MISLVAIHPDMRLCLFILTLMLSVSAFAQTDIQPSADTIQIVPDTRHAFYLFDPIQRVQSITYKQSGKQVLFKVVDEGKTVLLFGYEERQRILVEIVHKNGTTETIEKSPCDIYEDVAL